MRTLMRIRIVVLALVLLNGLTLSLVAQHIVGSDEHTSVLCHDGVVYSWGYNLDGLMGDGTTVNKKYPVRTHVSGVRQLYCANRCVCVVDSSGHVFIWGSVASQNQTGVPSWEWIQPEPKQIPYADSVRKIVMTESNIYYLRENGSMFVSGANWFGQYGNGTTIRLDSGWSQIPIDSVMDIFCGIYGAAYAVRYDGTIWAWGSNTGNLIDSTDTKYYLTPREFLKTPGIISSCGGTGGIVSNAGCVRVVTEEGDVYVWGGNDKNQLGVPNRMRVIPPVKLTLPHKAIALSGGEEHTLVLLNDGTVWSWGDNAHGQLGNPTTENSAQPLQVIGLTNVVSIGAGAFTSYAITTDGMLFSWGDNRYHQISEDDTPIQPRPLAITPPCSLLTSIPAEDQKHILPLAPNPVTDFLTITPIHGTHTLELYATDGRLVRSIAVLNSLPTTLNMSAELPGLYAIVQKTTTGVHFQTVVKQ